MRSELRALRRERGFTLVELMVALTVGALAITSIYAIGTASTRTFFQQHQLANAQTSLRNAINQLKRDISRAGYLATPNVGLPGQSCAAVSPQINDTTPGGNGRLAAISRFENNLVLSSAASLGNPFGNTGLDPTGTNRANGATTDDVVLFGNYATSTEYAGVSLDVSNPSAVWISTNWYGFHRDFTNWPFLARPEALGIRGDWFGDAFTANRLLRIRMPNGMQHFAQIRRVSSVGDLAAGRDAQVEFDPPVPTACVPHVVGAWIAPVSAIRYYARTAPPGGEDWLVVNSTGPHAQLVREEVLPTDKRTPVGPPLRVLLDYMVGFNLSFTMSDATPQGQPDAYINGLALPDPTDGDFASEVASINNNPERIRSVRIDLAARTPEQDPAFGNANLNCVDLRCFQVFSDRPGRARVRRLTAEVFVPNVAFEGW